jgi:electron transfer flavoprotein alpha subunit
LKIAVFCERRGDDAGELVSKARQLTADGQVIALYEEETDTRCFAAMGAGETILLGSCADDCAQGNRIADALNQLAPDAVLFPATIRGRFLSAWVAAKLETGVTADCTGLSVTKEGLLLQTRTAYGGSLTAEILCRRHRPQIASVRPGVFPPPMGYGISEVPKETTLQLQPVQKLLEVAAFEPVDDGIALQQAHVVVAGGKGLGSAKGFDKLFELAHLLNGVVGATRSAVDAGWIPYAHQVGQTGVTVRPKLYLAFGISGMVQHIVGMNGSQIVVAVNADRTAPIFDCADYGVVADWEATADSMIRYLKERKVSS